MTLAIVYSTGLCPYCFLAKRLLDRRGISYEERRRNYAYIARVSASRSTRSACVGEEEEDVRFESIESALPPRLSGILLSNA